VEPDLVRVPATMAMTSRGAHIRPVRAGFGALHQRLGGVDLGAADGRGSPQQVEAVDGDLDRAEAKMGAEG
jgi:hypothetical protein